VRIDHALTWFINGWIGLVVLLNIAELGVDIAIGGGLWGGIVEWFATWNWMTEVALPLLPALGAMAWRDRRRRRVSN
jgi:hypothetical protein